MNLPDELVIPVNFKKDGETWRMEIQVTRDVKHYREHLNGKTLADYGYIAYGNQKQSIFGGIDNYKRKSQWIEHLIKMHLWKTPIEMEVRSDVVNVYKHGPRSCMSGGCSIFLKWLEDSGVRILSGTSPMGKFRRLFWECDDGTWYLDRYYGPADATTKEIFEEVIKGIDHPIRMQQSKDDFNTAKGLCVTVNRPPASKVPYMDTFITPIDFGEQSVLVPGYMGECATLRDAAGNFIYYSVCPVCMQRLSTSTQKGTARLLPCEFCTGKAERPVQPKKIQNKS